MIDHGNLLYSYVHLCSLIKRIFKYIFILLIKLFSLVHVCYLRWILVFTRRFHKMFDHGNLLYSYVHLCSLIKGIFIYYFKLFSLVHVCYLRWILVYTRRFHKMFADGNLV